MDDDVSASGGSLSDDTDAMNGVTQPCALEEDDKEDEKTDISSNS